MSNFPLLEVKNLSIKYKTKESSFFAVYNVCFEMASGKTIALVGESGCGKSSIAKALLGISSITEGQIFYKKTLISKDRKKLPVEIKKDIQMIFQDPYSSLNPRMTIEEIIKEPLYIYKIGNKESQNKRVDELLLKVHLPLAYKHRYPHELSGGERQRVSIARALASNPKVLICDEPTHALDVSVQAAIINLLKDIQAADNLSMLFISHDLSLVKNLSDSCLIMYGGKIIESGPCESIFKHPKHPFTQTLLSSIPLFGNETAQYTEGTIENQQPKTQKISQLKITKEKQVYSQPISLDSAIIASHIKNLQQSNVKNFFQQLFPIFFPKKTSLKNHNSEKCPYLNKCNKKQSICNKKPLCPPLEHKTHEALCHFIK